MSDLEKVLKDFGIPPLTDLELNDQVLLSEYSRTGNQLFLNGVIMRALGHNISLTKQIIAVVEINDNLIALLKSQDTRIKELEEKIGTMYSFQKVSKKLN